MWKGSSHSADFGIEKGCITMITFRKAKMTDIENLHALINSYAQEGLMLARSEVCSMKHYVNLL